jgi:BlaI family transcriptional regulator, penicillinase repressor
MKPRLSKREEEVMEVIWSGTNIFAKDIIDSYDDPKPASTTISTLLKRMHDKGYIDYEQLGNSRRYFALVKKDDYFSKEVKGIISNFFNNSVSQFASFFAKSNNMTVDELEKLRDIIDNEIDRKKK